MMKIAIRIIIIITISFSSDGRKKRVEIFGDEERGVLRTGEERLLDAGGVVVAVLREGELVLGAEAEAVELGDGHETDEGADRYRAESDEHGLEPLEGAERGSLEGAAADGDDEDLGADGEGDDEEEDPVGEEAREDVLLAVDLAGVDLVPDGGPDEGVEDEGVVVEGAVGGGPGVGAEVED